MCHLRFIRESLGVEEIICDAKERTATVPAPNFNIYIGIN